MEQYTFRIGSNTNILGKPPSFYHGDDLVRQGCRFGSVYAVSAETAKRVSEAGTAAQFKGVVWSGRLWIDFDSEEAGLAFIEKCKKEEYDFVAYHTGNRGYHVGVLRDAEPSHILPYQDKAWAQANAPGADLSLYWHLHLIRLPGCIHEKTGKPKRLVSRESTERSIQVEPWSPKDDNMGSTYGRIPQGSRRSIWSVWEVLQRLQPVRRRELVELCHVLFREGSGRELALVVLAEANKSLDNPLDISEVQRIINWAYELKR